MRFPNLRTIALFAAAASILSIVIYLTYNEYLYHRVTAGISSQSIPLRGWAAFVASFLFGFPLLYLTLLISKAVREDRALFQPTLHKFVLVVAFFFLTPIGNLGLYPSKLAFVLFHPSMELVGDWPAMLKFFLSFITQPFGLPILVAAYFMSCIGLSGNAGTGGAIWRAVLYLWTVHAGLTLIAGVYYI